VGATVQELDAEENFFLGDATEEILQKGMKRARRDGFPQGTV
jgi:hypothetical protein